MDAGLNRFDLFHQAYQARWYKAKTKDPFEPKVLVRYRREHDLAVAVWEQNKHVLGDLRVASVIKLGNEETKESHDKPHGSSHTVGLRYQTDHSFEHYKPNRRLASHKE
jgi:hypothetical protein